VVSNALAEIELPELLLRLSSDHGRIARANAQLADVADRLASIDAAGSSDEAEEGCDVSQLWDEAADLLHFEHHFADRIHHPLEDRLFEAVLLKGLTPTERHLAFRNLGQHEEIMTMTEELSTMVSQGQKDPSSGIPLFCERVAEYLALQRRHMTFEETHMFPLLMSRLENEDWNQLNEVLQKQFSTNEPENQSP
jgi:hemerythrin-like domain-containing protein